VLAGSTLIATGAQGFNAAITSPGIKQNPNDTSLTGGLTGTAPLNFLVAKGVYLNAADYPGGCGRRRQRHRAQHHGCWQFP